MKRGLTRREFLRSSVVLGVGFSVGLPLLARMQDETSTPEVTPESMTGAVVESGVPLELTGAVRRVHDPAIIRGEDAYYLFSTGSGIPVRKSTDLLDWENAFPTSVFLRNPEWTQMIPNATDFWAPDISYFNGKYHLYYSVSTFGSNRSAIGLATNVALDREVEGYGWVDEGLVIETQRTDDHNAIDPNVVLDADGVPWLSFGSFWTGIKMRRLDLETGKPSDEDTRLYSLAQRTVNSGAVEASFIIRKGDFYYLFVSFDSCCQGVDSTYHVMVGRSEAVTGPYVDRDGVDLLDGGGTQVTFPNERWRGPGHNSILQDNGVEYIVYHAYDAENQGVPTLRIVPLIWDEEGWPSINEA